MLTFRGGGWVLALAGALALAAVLTRIVPPIIAQEPPKLGDGANAETYGFDLSTCLVDRDLLVGANMPRDELAPLDEPPVVLAAEVEAINRRERGKFLVPRDRVVGVYLHSGVARAYPLRILAWHELVHDTLGGVPIAVSYSPLTDSVVVFDRRLGDETLRLGVSGLLYNSNLVMYDKRPAGGRESLWSQLQARAIAGPLAQQGARLRTLAHDVCSWEQWRERMPQSDVIRGLKRLRESYQLEPYQTYAANDARLEFPVALGPRHPQYPAKAPCLILREADRTHVVIFDVAQRHASADGLWAYDRPRADTSAGLLFEVEARPATINVSMWRLPSRSAAPPARGRWITSGQRDRFGACAICVLDAACPLHGEDAIMEVAHAYWFAAHAMYPDARILRVGDD